MSLIFLQILYASVDESSIRELDGQILPPLPVWVQVAIGKSFKKVFLPLGLSQILKQEGQIVLDNELPRLIKTMLRERGYSKKAIREILKWYLPS